MGFLAPWFLAGLALVGVPLLIHLTRRDRANPVTFPSLMFVRRLPQPTTRRKALRDLPLLLLRILALLLLAAAFARPSLDRARRAVSASDGGREVVLLLDRSYSMGVAGRWARAQDAARRAVNTLGPNDLGTLVVFDNSATVLVARAAPAALRAAIDTLKPGAGATRYAPALATASRLLAASPLARREAVLVSDFQRGGWRERAAARLPAGARLTWTDVGGAAPADVAVAAVDLRRETLPTGERVTPVARLVATGGAPRTTSVALSVGGRPAQSRSVRLTPGAVASVAFEALPVAPGWTPATVRTSADSLPANDAFTVTFSRGQSLRALVLQGEGDGNAALYLRQALGGATGDGRASSTGASPIALDVLAGTTVGAPALASHTLIVLHDAPVRGTGARALADWVRRGGGLVVATGGRSAPEAWDPALAELLPARIGAVVDRTGGARLATVERTHPVFAPFAAPRSGDLGAPRVLRHRALTPSSDATVLARFDDGTPALVERAAGRGRVLLWASTLDTYWSDLPLDPIYVPFVRQLVTYAARVAPAASSYTVGQTIDPAALSAGDATSWVVETPAGRRLRVGADGVAGLVALSEPGVYTIRGANADASDAGTLVAANVDPAEADAARIPPADIARAVVDSTLTVPPATAAESETRVEREARQSIWWYLLAALFALLVAESLVASRRPSLAR